MIYGANVESLQETSSAIRAHIGTMESILTGITGQVESLEWTGPDADRFKTENGESVTQLITQVNGLLEEAAARLDTEAAEQEAASGG